MTGGWAATNTLRVAVACKFDCSEHEPTQDALALVEAALDAAAFALHSIDPNSTLAYNNLAAALRAVREGK